MFRASKDTRLLTFRPSAQGETCRNAGGPFGGQAASISRLCIDRFNGKYPHVGLYDCRERKVWVCKPLGGQAIRTAHARLITGADNATSTVWKDRFLCFWLYTPHTGEGYLHGYPIEWDDGPSSWKVHIDPNWDYDRQSMSPPNSLTTLTTSNLELQARREESSIFTTRSAA